MSRILKAQFYGQWLLTIGHAWDVLLIQDQVILNPMQRLTLHKTCCCVFRMCTGDSTCDWQSADNRELEQKYRPYSCCNPKRAIWPCPPLVIQARTQHLRDLVHSVMLMSASISSQILRRQGGASAPSAEEQGQALRRAAGRLSPSALLGKTAQPGPC